MDANDPTTSVSAVWCPHVDATDASSTLDRSHANHQEEFEALSFDVVTTLEAEISSHVASS